MNGVKADGPQGDSRFVNQGEELMMAKYLRGKGHSHTSSMSSGPLQLQMPLLDREQQRPQSGSSSSSTRIPIPSLLSDHSSSHQQQQQNEEPSADTFQHFSAPQPTFHIEKKIGAYFENRAKLQRSTLFGAANLSASAPLPQHQHQLYGRSSTSVGLPAMSSTLPALRPGSASHSRRLAASSSSSLILPPSSLASPAIQQQHEQQWQEISQLPATSTFTLDHHQHYHYLKQITSPQATLALPHSHQHDLPMHPERTHRALYHRPDLDMVSVQALEQSMVADFMDRQAEAESIQARRRIQLSMHAQRTKERQMLERKCGITRNGTHQQQQQDFPSEEGMYNTYYRDGEEDVFINPYSENAEATGKSNVRKGLERFLPPDPHPFQQKADKRRETLKLRDLAQERARQQEKRMQHLQSLYDKKAAREVLESRLGTTFARSRFADDALAADAAQYRLDNAPSSAHQSQSRPMSQSSSFIDASSMPDALEVKSQLDEFEKHWNLPM